MRIRPTASENTNAIEAPLTLEQLEEIDHRHDDVGPTLGSRLVCEDVAATAARERRAAARKDRQEARAVPAAPPVASEHRAAVLEAYGRRCAYCEKATGLGLTLLVSAASGGKPTQTNTVPACATCRKAQGNRDVLDWLEGQEKLDMARVFERINAATARLRKRQTLPRAA